MKKALFLLILACPFVSHAETCGEALNKLVDAASTAEFHSYRAGANLVWTSSKEDVNSSWRLVSKLQNSAEAACKAEGSEQSSQQR